MTPNKACAVVLRTNRSVPEILAFRHPHGDCQFVKGSIEVGESAAEGAARELWEEAGLAPARHVKDLGIWDTDYKGQVWSIHLLAVDQLLPDSWRHTNTDNGIQVFDFFWHPLDQPAGADWRPVYARALTHIAAELKRNKLPPFSHRS
jgi:8-oxo-dGTP pyrophosphatase MutT (NUDIX family)